MPTLCPLSHWPCWHRVHVVADYADTMSAWSTTTLTPCPRSQRLRRHHIRVVNYSVLLYFITSLRNQRLCRHNVSIVNNYSDRQFLKISSYISCYFFYFFQNKIISHVSSCGHIFFGNFFAKTKKFAKPFCLLIWGPGQIFKAKTIVKNLVTLSL